MRKLSKIMLRGDASRQWQERGKVSAEQSEALVAAWKELNDLLLGKKALPVDVGVWGVPHLVKGPSGLLVCLALSRPESEELYVEGIAIIRGSDES